MTETIISVLSQSRGFELEQKLIRRLPDLVVGLGEGVIRLTENCHKLPKELPLYGFTSFVDPRPINWTMEPLGGSYNWPMDIILPQSPELPYFDAALAIGLTYKKRLEAIAAAGIDDRNHEPILQIVQMQGYVEIDENLGRDRYKDSGLHGGLAWPDTLLSAWIKAAKQIGFTRVGMVSAANSSNSNGCNIAKRRKQYDEVALRAGFEREPILGNLVLEI